MIRAATGSLAKIKQYETEAFCGVLIFCTGEEFLLNFANSFGGNAPGKGRQNCPTFEWGNMSATTFGRPLAVVIAAIFFLAGCAHVYEPVYNVRNNPTAPGLSTAQVEQVIKTAAFNQAVTKWQLTDTTPGAMRGRVYWGGYSAETDILYSDKAYSITFVSEVNLGGKDGTIHRNYNRAVKQLEEEINRQLLAAAQ